MPFIAIALLIAAALGGGTAALAEQSMPGDPLWGFKIHVNEGVQGALSTSDQSKADWDIGAIEARLSEAQALQAQNKLDSQTQADITANFTEHAQGAEDAIAKLQSDGDAAAAADAAAHFQAVVAQFVSLNAGADASGKATALGQTARSVLDVASKLSAQTSAEAATEDSQKSGDRSTGDSAAASVNASTSVNTQVKPSIQGVGSDDDVHGELEGE